MEREVCLISWYELALAHNAHKNNSSGMNGPRGLGERTVNHLVAANGRTSCLRSSNTHKSGFGLERNRAGFDRPKGKKKTPTSAPRERDHPSFALDAATFGPSPQARRTESRPLLARSATNERLAA